MKNTSHTLRKGNCVSFSSVTLARYAGLLRQSASLGRRVATSTHRGFPEKNYTFRGHEVHCVGSKMRDNQKQSYHTRTHTRNAYDSACWTICWHVTLDNHTKVIEISHHR
jgi:hypothetical protein